MLPHFTRNMCKHVALSGKIDPKHRSGQYLGYRAFRYDLIFFRHAPNIFKCRCGSRCIDLLRRLVADINAIHRLI
jgi:hypothetical protein